MNLQELKKLSQEQLYRRWWDGQFPYDRAVGCEQCLTTHLYYCDVPAHIALKKASEALRQTSPLAALHDRLEEMYALRMFFKNFYPHTPEVEEPQIVEETVEAT